MKEEIKTQKGFIQIPLLIAIIVSIVAASGIGYGAVEYKKISNLVKEANQLAKEEKYNEANGKLGFAQNSWLVNNLGIKKQEITNEIEQNKILFEDKSEYTQGIEEFNRQNWVKAKELLSKVSENSPHHQDAKSRIEEAQNKLTEKQIAEATKKAVEGVKQEAKENQGEKENQIQSSDITSEDLQLYLDGIVLIQCNNSKGSGSLWKSGEQYSVLTNYHVVTTPYPDGRCDVMLLDRTTGNLKGAYAIYPNSSKRWNIYTDVAFLSLFRSTSWDSVMPSLSPPIASLNFKTSSLPLCQSEMSIGSPVVVIGYPAFGVKQWTSQIGGENLSGEQSTLIVSNGVISGYDSTVVKPIGNLPYPNYFVSTKIDSGNSGGVALSKTKNGLCMLGLPTWLNIGNYETQGLIQNIYNVFYQE